LKNKTEQEGTYIRVGSENRPADQSMLEELKRQARGVSYDQIPFGTRAMDDLSSDLFEYFVQKRNKVRDIPKVEFSENELKQLGLLTESVGTIHPTIGGYLLFSENPEDEFPQIVVRCARFKGTTMEETIDESELAEPLIYLPDEMMKFFKKHVNRGSKIGEIYREEFYEYPKVAIREAVINAICHRDYVVEGSEIKLAIFDDRIELTNPGGLPGRLSVDALGTGVSEIRNPVIARIFHQMGLIEKYGSGYQKIFKAMKELELPVPEFLDTGTFFKVIFRLKESLETLLEEVDLDEDEAKIVEFIQKQGTITLRETQELIGKSNKTASKKLKRLLDNKILKRNAESKTDPTAYYELRKKNSGSQ
jgi:predicted HTH transcriptional regulator